MKVLCRLAILLSFGGLLAACETFGGVPAGSGAAPGTAPGGVPVAAPAAAAAPGQGELLRFVAEESPGAQAVIDDQRGGILYIALIEREYVSARGRLCKRISLGRSADGGAGERHVACRGEEGWVLVRPLLGASAG